MLTIQQIKTPEPTDKQCKLLDRDGLCLAAMPAGGKLWRGKYRVNGNDELRTFLHALETHTADAATRLELRLLILTLARTRKVHTAKWAELDREEGARSPRGQALVTAEACQKSCITHKLR